MRRVGYISCKDKSLLTVDFMHIQRNRIGLTIIFTVLNYEYICICSLSIYFSSLRKTGLKSGLIE